MNTTDECVAKLTKKKKRRQITNMKEVITLQIL